MYFLRYPVSIGRVVSLSIVILSLLACSGSAKVRHVRLAKFKSTVERPGVMVSFNEYLPGEKNNLNTLRTWTGTVPAGESTIIILDKRIRIQNANNQAAESNARSLSTERSLNCEATNLQVTAVEGESVCCDEKEGFSFADEGQCLAETKDVTAPRSFSSLFIQAPMH